MELSHLDTAVMESPLQDKTAGPLEIELTVSCTDLLKRDANKTLLQVQLDSLGRSTLLWIIRILDSLSGDGRVFIVCIP